jgi:hypothetical protein
MKLKNGEYTSITARNTKVKSRSMTSVSAETGEKVADIFKLAHARNRVADPSRFEIGDR